MQRGDDPYKILAITPRASDGEVKKAYRQLALENHPDKQQDPVAKHEAEQIFSQVSAAFEVLNDKKTRKRYDNSQEEQKKACGKACGYDEEYMGDYFFKCPYEVWKKDFEDQFGFPFPGAVYDYDSTKPLDNSMCGTTSEKIAAERAAQKAAEKAAKKKAASSKLPSSSKRSVSSGTSHTQTSYTSNHSRGRAADYGDDDASDSDSPSISSYCDPVEESRTERDRTAKNYGKDDSWGESEKDEDNSERDPEDGSDKKHKKASFWSKIWCGPGKHVEDSVEDSYNPGTDLVVRKSSKGDNDVSESNNSIFTAKRESQPYSLNKDDIDQSESSLGFTPKRESSRKNKDDMDRSESNRESRPSSRRNKDDMDRSESNRSTASKRGSRLFSRNKKEDMEDHSESNHSFTSKRESQPYAYNGPKGDLYESRCEENPTTFPTSSKNWTTDKWVNKNASPSTSSSLPPRKLGPDNRPEPYKKPETMPPMSSSRTVAHPAPGSGQTALVKSQGLKGDNRPVGMETKITKIKHDDGVIETITEIRMMRPDGSVDRVRTTDCADKRPDWKQAERKPKETVEEEKPKKQLTYVSEEKPRQESYKQLTNSSPKQEQESFKQLTYSEEKAKKEANKQLTYSQHQALTNGDEEKPKRRNSNKLLTGSSHHQLTNGEEEKPKRRNSNKQLTGSSHHELTNGDEEKTKRRNSNKQLTNSSHHQLTNGDEEKPKRRSSSNNLLTNGDDEKPKRRSSNKALTSGESIRSSSSHALSVRS